MIDTPAEQAAADALTPDGTVRRIDDVAGGARLARALLRADRRVPVVVVTIHPDARGQPYLDADALAVELRRAAAVVLLSADATFGLTDGFGRRQLSVFFGAGRVYPVGTAWTRDMYAAPLHMCQSPARAPAVAEQLIADALTAAHEAGLLAPPASQPDDTDADVEVRGFIGSRYVQVEADDGRRASLLAAQLRVDVPANRLVRKRQRLHGRLRPTGGLLGAEFLPDPVEDDPLRRVREAFSDGVRTLARVTRADVAGATALLHPEVEVSILAEDVDLGLLLAVGDTIGVEVVWADDQPVGALLADPDPASLTPAIGVLPGSPPWLVPADLAPAAEPPGPAPVEAAAAAPVAGGGPPPAAPVPPRVAEDEPVLRTALDVNELLTHELEQARTTIAERDGQIRDLRRELRRSAAKRGRRPEEPVFRDAEQQLRHEIDLAYLRRIPEEDRLHRPMPSSYRIGPGFVGSLERLQGISRNKVLDVLVECLTGLDRELSGRQRHPWLTARSAEQDVRDDGARAWRVSLQSNTPGARRLKYWQLLDGEIEFDSVGHHDAGLG